MDKRVSSMRLMPIDRRQLMQGALAVAGVSGLSSVSPASTLAQDGDDGAPFPVFNRCDDCAPVSGGDARAFLTDFWQNNTNFWKTTAWLNAKRLAFNTLITHTDHTLTEFKPELAASWDLSDDGTVATLSLREGVLWHDGEPFTVADVDYTIHAFLNPNGPSTIGPALGLDLLVGADAYLDGTTDRISGVRAIDDYTIELETTQPVGFLFKLTPMIILPEHIFGSIAPEDLETAEATSQWVGTGPFEFVRYEPGQFAEFKRNDNYWNGVPLLDRLIAVEYQDQATAVLAYERGEVDLVMKLAGPDLDRLRELDGTLIVGAAVDFPNAYAFNFQRDYLQDPRVRQALMMAIDTNAIRDGLFGDTVQLTTSPMPHPLWTNPDLPETYPYDPEGAKQLLADAGWDGNLEIELSSYYDDQTTRNLLAAVQQFWAAAGVKAAVRIVDVASVFQTWVDGEFDVAYIGAQGSADPDLIATFIGCETTPEQGYQSFGSNFWRYCNPEIDAQFQEARAIVDTEERRQAYRDIQSEMAADLPYAPVWAPIRVAAVRENLVNGNWAQDYVDGNYDQAYETWFFAE
ncbi:MAG: ABC transporter substrate-binding protein [Thermomicrobiales bacterium]|nr:ABC transporter substrate-binding protein [Thermomicrobiales bacterium]